MNTTTAKTTYAERINKYIKKDKMQHIPELKYIMSRAFRNYSLNNFDNVINDGLAKLPDDRIKQECIILLNMDSEYISNKNEVEPTKKARFGLLAFRELMNRDKYNHKIAWDINNYYGLTLPRISKQEFINNMLEILAN